MYRISLGYEGADKLKAILPEEYDSIRKNIICLPENRNGLWGYDEFVMDLDGIEKILSLGIHPTIKQMSNTYSPNKPKSGWTENMDAIKNAVHVHIPNIGLLMIDQVLVLEDSCTNLLQEHLDQGWKILAICPPNGTRRPDYILGRQKAAL